MSRTTKQVHVTCECGAVVNAKSMVAHQKSAKHIAALGDQQRYGFGPEVEPVDVHYPQRVAHVGLAEKDAYAHQKYLDTLAWLEAEAEAHSLNALVDRDAAQQAAPSQCACGWVYGTNDKARAKHDAKCSKTPKLVLSGGNAAPALRAPRKRAKAVDAIPAADSLGKLAQLTSGPVDAAAFKLATCPCGKTYSVDMAMKVVRHICTGRHMTWANAHAASATLYVQDVHKLAYSAVRSDLDKLTPSWLLDAIERTSAGEVVANPEPRRSKQPGAPRKEKHAPFNSETGRAASKLAKLAKLDSAIAEAEYKAKSMKWDASGGLTKFYTEKAAALRAERAKLSPVAEVAVA